MLAEPQTSRTAVAAALAEATPADPWDAPYFGGPVYFRYPDFPAGRLAAPASVPAPAPDPAPVAPAALAANAETVTESSDEGEASKPSARPPVILLSTQPRRSWLARLFGRG